jgi:predicted ribosomally synthesized peptide with nif11-like leader
VKKEIEAFFYQAATNAELNERVTAAPNPEGVVALAAEMGFSFSVAELYEATVAISDEALEDVVGGATVRELTMQYNQAAELSSIVAKKYNDLKVSRMGH